MSTIKVDTLVANDGTSPVTLTKQDALKTRAVYNQHGSNTYMGIPNGSGGTDTINVSSYDDDSTGNAGVNMTNNMSVKSYSFFGNIIQTNNTVCIGSDSTTSAIELVIRDADSNAVADSFWYAANAGALA